MILLTIRLTTILFAITIAPNAHTEGKLPTKSEPPIAPIWEAFKVFDRTVSGQLDVQINEHTALGQIKGFTATAEIKNLTSKADRNLKRLRSARLGR